jgi:geranylgeranyl diphosphate synthase type I
MLVHDDIVDRATTRRGEPSLHVLLRPEPSRSQAEVERQRVGADLALVAGDWLYTAALEAMLRADVDAAARHRALGEVLAVCRDTARGQYDDVAFASLPLGRVTPDEVLSVYRRKTARYTFEAPLVTGALLGGADAGVVDALRSFADSAGIAFQLVDDLLALLADDGETGKPGLSDLREAKKTWPLLTAFASCSPLERAWLEELFVRRDAGERDLMRVRAIVGRTGAREAALAEVRRHCEAAQVSLALLPRGACAEELAALVGWLRRQAEALS